MSGVRESAAVAVVGRGVGRGRLERWRYASAGRRDARLDLLRGFAVFAMICDHVAGASWISPLTGANQFVVSAAEGFVFLAGLVTGMVYGQRIRRDGWLPGAEAILRRAAVLYGATVGLTLLFVALFQLTDLKLWLDRDYGLGLTDPVELVVGTLTLHYTYHGTDILWMYTILIAVSPLLFLALRAGHSVPILVGSWLLWGAYQFFPNQATIPWVATNVNYFPVAAWQVLFVNGLVWGYHRESVTRVLRRTPPRLTLVVFGIGLAMLVLVDRARASGRLAGWPVLGGLAGEAYFVLFDKPTLALGRLAAFAILAGFAYSLVTVAWEPIRRGLGWLLLPLGTGSLRAYGVHLIAIVLVYNVDALAGLYDRSRTGNTILQVVTVGLTLGVILAWNRLAEGVGWPATLPAWPARLASHRPLIGMATVLILVLTVGGTALVGPVRGYRQTDLTSATAEASTLRFIPREAAAVGPLTVLLALHADGQSGPQFARPLIDVARENGWALIAPTIPYGDWGDAGQVAADAADVLPLLKELLDGMDEHAEARLHPRILVLGSGRGAHTARQLALFYPDVVAAVATVGPAPCTLPTSELRGAALPFPFGVDDLEQYVGDELDEEALRQTAFWIGVESGSEDAVASCPWGVLSELPPAERAQLLTTMLGRLGAEAHAVDDADPAAGERLLPRAIAFLRAHAPRVER